MHIIVPLRAATSPIPQFCGCANPCAEKHRLRQYRCACFIEKTATLGQCYCNAVLAKHATTHRGKPSASLTLCIPQFTRTRSTLALLCSMLSMVLGTAEPHEYRLADFLHGQHAGCAWVYNKCSLAIGCACFHSLCACRERLHLCHPPTSSTSWAGLPLSSKDMVSRTARSCWLSCLMACMKTSTESSASLT